MGAFDFITAPISSAWDATLGSIGGTGNPMASAANPAAQRGTPRAGQGPNVANYSLGGDPNWLANFAGGQAGVAGQAQQMGQAAQQVGNQGAGLMTQGAQAGNRGAPITAYGQGVATGQAQNAAGGAQQYALADQLRQLGGAPAGPSAAQAQLQAGNDAAMQAQLSAARSGSGFGESANAMQAAQGNAAQLMAGNANQSGQLRAQEDQAHRARQLQALGMSGEQLAQGRGADLALAAQQIGQGQFGTQTSLAQQQANDALRNNLTGQGLQAQQIGLSGQQAGIAGQNQANQLAMLAAQAEQQGLMGYEGDLTDIYQIDAGSHDTARELNQKKSNDWVGGITGFIEGIGSLSDRRSKKNIEHEDLSRVYRALGGK